MTTLKKTKQDHQFWQEHLSQWRGSKLSQAAYCRQHGLSQNNFSYHKRKGEQPTELVPIKSSGFIRLPLPQVLPADEPLTLHLPNGMLVSGIAPGNIALVKHLALELL